jgi:hypothetical protein
MKKSVTFCEDINMETEPDQRVRPYFLRTAALIWNQKEER